MHPSPRCNLEAAQGPGRESHTAPRSSWWTLRGCGQLGGSHGACHPASTVVVGKKEAMASNLLVVESLRNNTVHPSQKPQERWFHAMAERSK